MACRRGHPLPRGRRPLPGGDGASGPPERWDGSLENEVSRQGRGCGPLPQPLLSRMDKPVLPWQPDRRLTAKREPFCTRTLTHSGSPQYRPWCFLGAEIRPPGPPPQT